MSQSALINHRPWLLAAVVAAVIYYIVKETALGGVWVMLIKGAAVACLGFYALRRSPKMDAKILAVFLMLCAMGDMGIQISREIGGGLFFAGHLVGIALFLRNVRGSLSPSQKGLAVALVAFTPLVSWLISGDVYVTLYSVVLGAMTSTAWISRFPRYRTGLGTVLFVISDWLLFARSGILSTSVIPDLVVWPIYFTGQFMIATGVIQSLRGEHGSTDIVHPTYSKSP